MFHIPEAGGRPLYEAHRRIGRHRKPACVTGAGPSYGRARWSAARGKGAPQAFDLVRLDAVVGPAPSLLAAEQARVVQHLEVVADGRLGEPERTRELRLADLAAGMFGDEVQDAQPGGIGHDPERRRHPLRALLVEQVEEDQRAAGLDWLDGSSHASTY